MAGLNTAYDEVVPPPGTYGSIEERLFGNARPAVGWWHSVVFWRRSALAALLGMFMVSGLAMWQAAQQSVPATRLVVSLAGEDSPLRLVALIDSTGSVRLSGEGSPLAADRDLELWYVGQNSPPVSLGVLNRDAPSAFELEPEIAGKLGEGATLAISLEPRGGSPTGQPTGPVLAAGQARKI